MVGGPGIHYIRQLEAAGHSSVPEGARVKVRIGQGQKGAEVTEVIEVDPRTIQVTSPIAGRSARHSSLQRQTGVGGTTECVGSVKMYDSNKGFGFIGQDGGGKNVFVDATTLERGGLSGLTEGQRVRMQIGQGQKAWRRGRSNSWTERPPQPACATIELWAPNHVIGFCSFAFCPSP